MTVAEATTQEQPKGRSLTSKEAQEELVNRIAQMMVELGKDGSKWKAGWKQGGTGFPFCVATGKQYSGANAIHLMLADMFYGFNDSRWLTFNQMKKMQSQDESLKDMHVKKGEKSTTILRPEVAYFIIDPETEKRRFLSMEEVKAYLAERQNSESEEEESKSEKVHKLVLYKPFKVFNAAQIEGFPPADKNFMQVNEVERNDMVERFIASSGVEVRHTGHQPCFKREPNRVEIPVPQDFQDTEEYYAAKLHEFFHATGHKDREDRLTERISEEGKAAYAFEEMRAEIFSMLAGAHLGLPMPEKNSAAYITSWNKKFSGGEAKEVFNAARDAAKILTLLAQFEAGEEPVSKWYPQKAEWPRLLDDQKQRDKMDNVIFASEAVEEEEALSPGM